MAASQAVSLLTAQVFEVKLDTFHFVFSPAAAGKTILYFAIIFVVVMALGSVSISRQKLIDLLSAQKKNQTFRAKKLWHSVVLFLLLSLIHIYIAVDALGLPADGGGVGLPPPLHRQQQRGDGGLDPVSYTHLDVYTRQW